MAGKKKVIIAEDHTIVRAGLRALLDAEDGLEVVGEAEDGRQAVNLAEELEPDLVLMDMAMPRLHGLEAIREITKRASMSRVLVLTMHRNEEYILASFKAGAFGYVLKDATQAELILAVKTVLSGKRYVSPDISDMVIDRFVGGGESLKPSSSYDSLTPREREILKLIAEGGKNKEIADQLCISVKTVERHRANLMKKLDLHNVSALTALAIEKGLI